MRIATILALAALAGCGGKHPGSYQITAAGAAGPTDAATAEADAHWAQRADAEKLRSALVKYEEVLAADPTDRHALEQLTRGWYFLGDGFVDDTPTKLEYWGKAIGYGTQCLSLNEDFAKKIASGAKERDAAAAATKADVPCLYWTASALGKWGRAQSLSTTLKHLPTVKAYISKVEELDPQYFNYGPARYWGAYYAALPSFAGRDFVKSGEYFAASIAGAPHYLGTRVLRAEILAVGTDDVALFDQDLKFVLEYDVSTHPDVAAENGREQVKAGKLLAERQEKFSKADPATAPAIERKAAPASAPAEPAGEDAPADEPTPDSAEDATAPTEGGEAPAGDSEAPAEGSPETPTEGTTTEGE